MSQLDNKVVLITGGTKGIGKELVLAFKDKNSRIALCSRNENEIHSLVNSLGIPEHQVYFEACNVADFQQTKNFVKNAHNHFGKIDIVVNNAGIGHFKNFEDIDLIEWNEMFSINVNGAYNIAKNTLPYLMENETSPKGYIFIVGSLSHSKYVNGNSGYSSTKSALNTLSEHLYNEYRTQDINVTYISPGSVQTSFSKRNITNFDWKIKPSSVANYIVQLANDAYNYPDSCVTYAEVRAKNPIKTETFKE